MIDVKLIGMVLGLMELYVKSHDPEGYASVELFGDGSGHFNYCMGAQEVHAFNFVDGNVMDGFYRWFEKEMDK